VKLTAAGVKLLTQLGKLTIDVKLTIASPGQATVTAKKTIHVVLAKPKHKKHKHS
jgi:hypothetical protein